MTRLCLTQVRLQLLVAGRPLDGATEAALKADPRTGAREILDAVARRRFENRSEGQRLRKMLRYETALWQTGIVRVAGQSPRDAPRGRGPVGHAAAGAGRRPASQRPGYTPAAPHQGRRQELDDC